MFHTDCMNNEFNQNVRTLIVSFVLALMVMVPLRFVEVGSFVGQQQVLGDSITYSEPRLEAPYDTIELNSDCLANDYVDKVVAFLKDDLEVTNFESRRCK